MTSYELNIIFPAIKSPPKCYLRVCSSSAYLFRFYQHFLDFDLGEVILTLYSWHRPFPFRPECPNLFSLRDPTCFWTDTSCFKGITCFAYLPPGALVWVPATRTQNRIFVLALFVNTLQYLDIYWAVSVAHLENVLWPTDWEPLA